MYRIVSVPGSALTVERRDIVVMECTRVDRVDHGWLMATFWLVWFIGLETSRVSCPDFMFPNGVVAPDYQQLSVQSTFTTISIHKLSSQVGFIAPSPLVYRVDSGS